MASPRASVINMVNNVIGAGLLSMPWAFRQSSIVTGLLTLLVIGVLNIFSLLLLARSCDLSGSFSYKEMGSLAYGRRAGLIIQWTVALYTVMSCISYVVLIGDFIPDVVEFFQPDFWGMSKEVFRASLQIGVGLCVFLPLSFLKNLEILKYPSSLAFLGIGYATVLLVVKVVMADRISSSVEMLALKPCLGGAIPIMNVAFTLHYNGPRFYYELKQRSLKRWAAVASLAYVVCGSIYVTAALCGYLLFGGNTEGNILNNFDSDDEAAILARLSLAFVIIFTYPLAFHSLRNSTIALAFPQYSDEVTHVRVEQEEEPLHHEASDLGATTDSFYSRTFTTSTPATPITPSPMSLAEIAPVYEGARSSVAETQMGSARVSVADIVYDAAHGHKNAHGGSERSASGASSATNGGVVMGGGTFRAKVVLASINILLLAVITAFGVAFTEVEVVLAYKGALFGSLIVYIYPVLLYSRFLSRANGHSHAASGGADVPLDAKLAGDSLEGTALLGAPVFQGVLHGCKRTERCVLGLMIFWGVALGILGLSLIHI